MKKSTVNELEDREAIVDPLTELLREGAQRLIQQAVGVELEALLAEHGGRRTEAGTAGIVRNGFLPERELTGVGPVTVRIPKVRAKTGEPITFRSALVPPYVRKTKSLEAAVPWLYLKGVSSGEMGEGLKVLVGPEVSGLSPGTVSRLKQVWGEEYRRECDARLDGDRWVYVWVDGIYSGLRAEQTKLCALVVIGVNEHGEKRFLAIEDGVRESTQSWREVLLKLKSRGMNVPDLAIEDGAMGFWAALEEIYPEARRQRCWMHKTMNGLMLGHVAGEDLGAAHEAAAIEHQPQGEEGTIPALVLGMGYVSEVLQKAPNRKGATVSPEKLSFGWNSEHKEKTDGPEEEYEKRNRLERSDGAGRGVAGDPPVKFRPGSVTGSGSSSPSSSPS